MRQPIRTLVHALLFLAIGAGCAQASTSEGPVSAPSCAEGAVIDGRPLRVVTTVAPITNIVANIAGGSGTEIVGLVPEGTNSHTFEPPPSAAEALERADVVFINGLVLEEPTKELASANLQPGGEICELVTTFLPEKDWIYDFSFPKEGGKPNPHAWTDPTLATEYARVARDVLATRDPANAALYVTNFDAFAQRIDELDAAVRAATQSIPKERRKLLTYHDAYAYFARTYDWEVIGAIQPSSFDEPTPREVVELIEQVKAADVPAVFGSEVFPSPVLEQIGKEAGVQYIDVLRDDDLPGAPGDPDHSWLALMQFDYVTMVEALGGDATALRALDVSDVAPATALYPQ